MRRGGAGSEANLKCRLSSAVIGVTSHHSVSQGKQVSIKKPPVKEAVSNLNLELVTSFNLVTLFNNNPLLH